MPVLTDIREEIKSMIGAMRVADGFNYDWESVNPSFFSMANTGQIYTTPGKPVAIVEDLDLVGRHHHHARARRNGCDHVSGGSKIDMVICDDIIIEHADLSSGVDL